MNRIFHIVWIGMIIYFSSCAISKKENERIDKMLSSQAIPFAMDASLVSDSLSQENLRNFELRAIQKVIDLYDYLAILGDANYKKSIREEIKNSAEDQFFDAHTPIQPFIDDTRLKEYISVEMYLDQVLFEKNSNLNIITNVKISQILESVNKHLFIGKISFELRTETEGNEGGKSKYVDFSLRKIEKDFGNESLRIWEVYLDRIY